MRVQLRTKWKLKSHYQGKDGIKKIFNQWPELKEIVHCEDWQLSDTLILLVNAIQDEQSKHN